MFTHWEHLNPTRYSADETTKKINILMLILNLFGGMCYTKILVYLKLPAKQRIITLCIGKLRISLSTSSLISGQNTHLIGKKYKNPKLAFPAGFLTCTRIELQRLEKSWIKGRISLTGPKGFSIKRWLPSIRNVHSCHWLLHVFLFVIFVY